MIALKTTDLKSWLIYANGQNKLEIKGNKGKNSETFSYMTQAKGNK